MNEDDICAKLDTLIDINHQSQQWLKILAWDSAREVIETNLNENREYHLYEELDGETSIGDVVDNTSVPRRTVYTRLDEWQQVGIITKIGRGKYEKIASLADLGIDLPALKEEQDGEE